MARIVNHLRCITYTRYQTMLIELADDQCTKEDEEYNPSVVLDLEDYADSYDGQTFTMTASELRELLHDISTHLTALNC